MKLLIDVESQCFARVFLSRKHALDGTDCQHGHHVSVQVNDVNVPE